MTNIDTIERKIIRIEALSAEILDIIDEIKEVMKPAGSEEDIKKSHDWDTGY